MEISITVNNKTVKHTAIQNIVQFVDFFEHRTDFFFLQRLFFFVLQIAVVRIVAQMWFH